MGRIDWQEFEDRVCGYFESKLDTELEETACVIGSDHVHKFDLVSPDRGIVIECKSYTWTNEDNFPSAKVSTANEALLFLSRVDAGRKMLVMQDDLDESGRSLVKTYVDMYGGVMDDTEIWRYLPRTGSSGEFEKVRDSGGVYSSGEKSSRKQPSTSIDADQSYFGKYVPLYLRLASASVDTIQFEFDEINDLLDSSLPDSAYQYRAWWNPSGHSHAEGWESVGWTVSTLDLASERVEFVKK